MKAHKEAIYVFSHFLVGILFFLIYSKVGRLGSPLPAETGGRGWRHTVLLLLGTAVVPRGRTGRSNHYPRLLKALLVLMCPGGASHGGSY